ncbi:hypothetical protein EF847_18005 [Actinobacteria bacterium YIM 96077]|uniref:Peptidase inhibitor family I36 protein n=1 Tax=Phytoactinopolyspora halophila TaxID=1981511 RepID=A0A329QR76_9ACTN|nr:peptidase inhibitor family I36 protein [Phytoactinopolyspora halophila]AYY14308.1 hypothetical protein EF847_18005 [Actinobacteria bacterium YIM 96077]RAW14850.1 hypothetical protein DPM12_10220 [Phytoactinopolyspora halophila]
MRHTLSAWARRSPGFALGALALLMAPFATTPASSGPDTLPAAASQAAGVLAVGTSGDTVSEDEPSPSGPLADEMAEMLDRQPGGVQVSDQAMAWDDGATVVVWPAPGESRAPAGLGANVREGAVQQMDLERQATGADLSPMGTYTSCPSGYYCFYTGTNYDGMRYQFSNTCSSYASSWGFNNQATSWVNRAGSNKIIYAYDYNGGQLLWYEPHPSRSTYVGSGDNNRMSYWTCSHTQ